MCCERLRVAVQLDLPHLSLLFERSGSLRWSKSRKKNVTFLVRKWSLRTRLRSPNPKSVASLDWEGVS